MSVVSHETRQRLALYEAELRRWQRVKNLVGRTTLDAFTVRHLADSLQLADLADGEVWADLGTGAGLPGLVVAIARPDRLVHLVDSDSRKCAFLRHAARTVGANVRVWEGRIDSILPQLDPRPQVVTARALAALAELLGMAGSLLMEGAVGLFPKGRSWQSELTRARESWRFEAGLIPSVVDPEARIIRVRRFAGRQRKRSDDLE